MAEMITMNVPVQREPGGPVELVPVTVPAGTTMEQARQMASTEEFVSDLRSRTLPPSEVRQMAKQTAEIAGPTVGELGGRLLGAPMGPAASAALGAVGAAGGAYAGGRFAGRSHREALEGAGRAGGISLAATGTGYALSKGLPQARRLLSGPSSLKEATRPVYAGVATVDDADDVIRAALTGNKASIIDKADDLYNSARKVVSGKLRTDKIVPKAQLRKIADDILANPEADDNARRVARVLIKELNVPARKGEMMSMQTVNTIRRDLASGSTYGPGRQSAARFGAEVSDQIDDVIADAARQKGVPEAMDDLVESRRLRTIRHQAFDDKAVRGQIRPRLDRFIEGNRESVVRWARLPGTKADELSALKRQLYSQGEDGEAAWRSLQAAMAKAVEEQPGMVQGLARLDRAREAAKFRVLFGDEAFDDIVLGAKRSAYTANRPPATWDRALVGMGTAGAAAHTVAPQLAAPAAMVAGSLPLARQGALYLTMTPAGRRALAGGMTQGAAQWLGSFPVNTEVPEMTPGEALRLESERR